MKKNCGFDSRNTGGLKVMADHMFKHHKALVDAKPAIKIKPPKPHVDQKKKEDVSKPVDLPMYKNKKEYDNVIKTFQTVIQMKKGLIDTNAPISMDMRRMITGNLTKKEKFTHSEHQLNLQSQYRRMQSAGSKQERSKNQNDPVAHPPRFFRREGQSVAHIKIDKLLQHLTKEHRHLDTSTDSRLVKKIDNLNQIKTDSNNLQGSNRRVQSAKPPTSKPKQTPQKNDPITTFVDTVPTVKGANLEDYDQLQKELIVTMFKHRVYKTDDMEALFGRVLVHNPQLELDLAENMFQRIRDEFQE